MKNILTDLSKYAVLINKTAYSEEQKETNWLGVLPATELAIKSAEKRLNYCFPSDYTELLRISNGFPQTIDSVNSTLLPVEKIDLFYNLEKEIVDIWGEENPQLGKVLKRSILIGGFQEEQQVLLIPPKNENLNWACWKFAHWIPGERRFRSFTRYLKSELDFLKSLDRNSKIVS